MRHLSRLHAQGRAIVDTTGQPVPLRGVGIGGWLNMENFIFGYPGTESGARDAVATQLGAEVASDWFEAVARSFFADPDARFLAELGFNHVRLPLNYRRLLGDADPDRFQEGGLALIDEAVEVCERNGLYAILDLHALPGFQNQEWHSDNPTHRAFLWDQEVFKRQAETIWRELARRYGARPSVGFNLINEPGDPSGHALVELYQRLLRVVRAEAPDTLVFLDANRYSTDTQGLDRHDWDNVVIAIHDYALPGLVDGGAYPGFSRGQYIDRAVVREAFERRGAHVLEADTPLWVGEFGPVYTGDPERDLQRRQLLQDQLDIYEDAGAGWCVWTYKDLGLQGLLTPRADSAWREFIAPMIDRKRQLGTDAWGTTDVSVAHLVDPIVEFLEEQFPDYHPYPFGKRRRVSRLIRHILFSEALLEEFGAMFRGVSQHELQQLAESWRFEGCTVNEELSSVLSPIRSGRQGGAARD